MAMATEQQNHRLHFCRICKKGFSCGRALGGHMRAHCLAEDPIPAGGKRSRDLRATSRFCENCGMQFSSWKSFFDHRRCINSDEEFPPESPASAIPVVRKLTEEEELATCLVMLSAAQVDPPCFSDDSDESYVGIPLVNPPSCKFECKACKRIFPSHQALGGHRASHKKVKGCFAEADISFQPLKKKAKLHECSICGRQFSSGQALGGHKRCHWITSNSTGEESIEHELITFHPLFQSSDATDLNIHASKEENSDEEDEKLEDEVERKVKLAKLSDDLMMGTTVDGGSSPWLQVGIGSTSDN